LKTGEHKENLYLWRVAGAAGCMLTSRDLSQLYLTTVWHLWCSKRSVFSTKTTG